MNIEWKKEEKWTYENILEYYYFFSYFMVFETKIMSEYSRNNKYLMINLSWY